MKYTDHKTVEDLKIAYVGGGSQGWAWCFMSDLAAAKDISGTVALYDIDFDAAKKNEIIGNKYNDLPECETHWNYVAVKTLEEALTGADFVVISILPGTFDEMHSDVHTPEKYGILQSVGDTTGPGGIIRALRTIPQMEVIAKGVEKCCPDAWVINYTNPMALCVKALYDTFPKIKAYGCCHEVFGAKKVLVQAIKEKFGEETTIDQIKTNVVGVNHFTWLTDAIWKNIDLFPVYQEFINNHREEGYNGEKDQNWMTPFKYTSHVKFDLFERFGYIAAAGDRHLAEFCPKHWFIDNQELIDSFGFALTTVDYRRKSQQDRLDKGQRLLEGTENVAIVDTGEEGVLQIRALLGLTELISNVNLPNEGQIPNLPLGAVVETNAIFRDGCLRPVFAGNVPGEFAALVQHNAEQQLQVAQGAKERDLERVFLAFMTDPQIAIPAADARKLFDEMIENTKAYLTDYNL